MIDPITADQMTGDYLGAHHMKRLVTAKSPARVYAEKYAADWGIAPRDFFGPTRERAVCWPRQDCMYKISTKFPKMSLSQIGAIFGGRDHTTVINARKRAAYRAMNRDEFRWFYNPTNPNGAKQ